MTIRQRVAGPAPKKLLALDGGGIRGVVTLEVLARMEAMLRQETGNPRLLLADYFDYIAGTSTGAIIAAGLCMGMDTRTLRQFYRSYGPAIFARANLWHRLTRHKYHSEELTRLLQELFGEGTTLGSPRLRSLLMIVMRNATTDQRWLVTNNPRGKYNAPERADCNLQLPLWQLVRASAAAPAYFEPQPIVLAKRAFQFMDGGIANQNNPAFQLFLMATLAPYKLCWATGEDAMLLVSVGTGQVPIAPPQGPLNLLETARQVPAALMAAALNEQDRLCRVFGRCLVGDPLDGEVGDLHQVQSPAGSKQFTYLRYDARLSADGLARLGLMDLVPAQLSRLDAVHEIENLQRLGQALAERVDARHYRAFLGHSPLRQRAPDQDGVTFV